jgi:hypothetical protein
VLYQSKDSLAVYQAANRSDAFQGVVVHAVFLAPGIMDTELLMPDLAGGPDEKAWPPTALETQFGYKRREKPGSPALCRETSSPMCCASSFIAVA